jgi:hypothetical protein
MIPPIEGELETLLNNTSCLDDNGISGSERTITSRGVRLHHAWCPPTTP